MGTHATPSAPRPTSLFLAASKEVCHAFDLTKSLLVTCACLAPPALRRRAVGQLANRDGSSAQVEFRYLQNTRLRVTLVITGDDGRVQEAHNTWDDGDRTADPLEGSIRAAQREIVDHEVFSAIVREAATLPTASASVSEQLTTIEAAQGIELRFELVRPSATEPCNYGDPSLFTARH
jgi:mediator of RNA polymerase II transcription subunit 17